MNVTTDEAINELGYLLDYHLRTNGHHNITRADEALQMAIEALRREQWIPVSERLPECEVEVMIQTANRIITSAVYEDGKMSEDNSSWSWTDVEYNYDEKTDTYFVPEGWWECRHYNPDEIYNNVIDDKVIAWRPLPEYYKENINDK